MTSVQRPAHAIALDVDVALHQCDPLAVVWHGRYFEWFEAARGKLFASVDLDVPQVRELGYRIYMVDARCRYMAPLVYGDRARITAWFSAVAPLIRVGYDVHHLDSGRWSARATTVLATTDPDGALLASTPPALLARLPAR